MSWYPLLKHVHLTAVGLSFILFVLRGGWMLLDSPALQRRWVKIVPHVVDTVLLASALVLAYLLHQYPFVHGWLTAKVVGLVVYIGLGTVALKRGRTKRVRTVALVAALLTFAYIVRTALLKSPWPF